MQVQPYLFFDGRCDEAIDFYKKTLGAEVQMLMRFKDGPDKSMCSPANENKVKGRNETGPNKNPMDWVKRHDEYENARAPHSCCA